MQSTKSADLIGHIEFLSAVGTTRWLQCDQTLPLSCEGCGLRDYPEGWKERLLLVRFVWHIANVPQPHPRTRPHETLRIDRAISTFELEKSEELVWCSLTYAYAQLLQAMVRGWSWRDERVRQANQATAEEQSSHGTRRSHLRLYQR